MQVPLKVSTHRVELRAAEERLIRRQVELLERFCPRLTRCEVVLNGMSDHHQTGGPIAVRLHLGVPGGELTVDRQEGENPTAALRQAFSAGRRQLQDWVRIQRRAIKRHGAQTRGKVIRLFPAEGYGFLETRDGREVYFHAHSVLESGFDTLEIGSEVRFHEEQGDEGPQASSMTLVRGGASSSKEAEPIGTM